MIIAFLKTTIQKRLPQISQISTDAFCSKVLCKSAESVGDYFFFPRNSQNSQNLQLVVSVSSVNSVGDYFLPTEHTEFTEPSARRFREFCEFCGRLFFFPRNTRNSQNLQLVVSVSSVNSVGDYLSRKFCVFCEFCGRLSQQKVLCILCILREIIDDGLAVAEAGDLRYVQGVTGYSARTPPLPRSKPSPGCDTARR